MSDGIFTMSSSGEYLMHTDIANNVFFKSNGTYAVNGPIASENFITNFALATAIAPVTWGLDPQYHDSITTAGSTLSDGTAYVPPYAYWIEEAGAQKYWIALYVKLDRTHVHAFGTTQNVSGFGFACNSSNQSIAVSEEYKGFSIHKNSAGSKIRTGSCTGLAFMPSAQYGNTTTFTQPTGINIVFDKPYESPPLIFIVESSGPIAFNFMSRDGNGKYVGAEIIPAASIVNSGDARGLAAFGNNSATFSYFIVSSELPQYPDANPYGMKVFNSSNVCIFDSSSFIPSINSVIVPKPYFSLDSDWYYRSHSNSTFTIDSNYYGVCINNFNAFTGTAAYSSWSINGVYGGPINFCGRYINKNSTSITLQGSPTLAFLRSPSWADSTPASWDFHRQADQNMAVLYANYTL